MAFAFFVQASYKAKALNHYTAAMESGQKAIRIGYYIFPKSSERMHSLVMFVADLYALTEASTNVNRGRAALEVWKYVGGRSAILGLERAQLLYEAARMANDSLSPSIAGGLLVKATQAIQSSDDGGTLKFDIAVEKAFADLLDISLAPQRESKWVALVEAEFDQSHKTLCKTDAQKCNFLSARWALGKQIRKAWLGLEGPECVVDCPLIKDEMIKLCSGEFDLDTCMQYRNRLARYINATFYEHLQEKVK